jgi:hypothetical protein
MLFQRADLLALFGKAKDWAFGDDIRKRFDALTDSMGDNHVPVSVLHRFLFGSINPETGKDAPGFAYSRREKRILLAIAEANAARIRGLPDSGLHITCGSGPGTGKTTAMFKLLASTFNIAIPDGDWHEASLAKVLQKFNLHLPLALVSADRDGMFKIAHYLGNKVDETFYKKWRWGSNFISNLTYNTAKKLGKGIAHDSTLGSPHAVDNLRKARKNGEFVFTVLPGAAADVRQQSVDQRNHVYFQSLPVNFTQQDTTFAGCLSDIVRHSDEILLQWRDGVDQDARPVAIIDSNLSITVSDYAGLHAFSTLYPQMKDVTHRLIMFEKRIRESRFAPLANALNRKADATAWHGAPMRCGLARQVREALKLAA